jgi:glutamate 5-kinase
MTYDLRMFTLINENDSNEIDSITLGDNGKGKVKGLGSSTL